MNFREYRYSSIFFMIIAIGVVAGLTEVLIGEDSYLSSVITGITGMLGNYIVCAGLLNNRMGNVSDYLSNIKLINIKVIGVNLITSLLFVVISMILGVGALFTSPLLNEKNTTVFAIVFLILLYGIFYILTAYTNFVLSDKRFRNLGFFASIGQVLKAGFKLSGKTLLLSLKYYALPIILIVLILMGTRGEKFVGLTIIAIPIFVIYVIVLVFLLPGFVARLSNIYLDYVEENYPYEPIDLEKGIEEDNFYSD